jgi:fluoride exporter
VKVFYGYLAVGMAGSLGSMLRYFVATTCGRYFGSAFPVGTFVINITGSFVLGWFLVVVQGRDVISDTMRVAVAVGFVGAYTTFSTFCLESSALLESGSGVKALANMLGSLICGLIAVRLGIALASR